MLELIAVLLLRAAFLFTGYLLFDRVLQLEGPYLYAAGGITWALGEFTSYVFAMAGQLEEECCRAEERTIAKK